MTSERRRHVLRTGSELPRPDRIVRCSCLSATGNFFTARCQRRSQRFRAQRMRVIHRWIVAKQLSQRQIFDRRQFSDGELRGDLQHFALDFKKERFRRCTARRVMVNPEQRRFGKLRRRKPLSVDFHRRQLLNDKVAYQKQFHLVSLSGRTWGNSHRQRTRTWCAGTKQPGPPERHILCDLIILPSTSRLV